VATDSGRSYQPESIGGTKVADVLGGGQELPLFGVDDGKRGPEPIGYNPKHVDAQAVKGSQIEVKHLQPERFSSETLRAKDDAGDVPAARVQQSGVESQLQEQAAMGQGGPQ